MFILCNGIDGLICPCVHMYMITWHVFVLPHISPDTCTHVWSHGRTCMMEHILSDLCVWLGQFAVLYYQVKWSSVLDICLGSIWWPGTVAKRRKPFLQHNIKTNTCYAFISTTFENGNIMLQRRGSPSATLNMAWAVSWLLYSQIILSVIISREYLVDIIRWVALGYIMQ